MKKGRYLMLLLLAIPVFVLSETLYIYSHTDQLSYHAINLAKFLSAKGKTETAYYVLANTAGIIGNRNYKKYVDKFNQNDYKTKLPLDGKFTYILKSYIKQMPNPNFESKGSYNLGLVFYNLGVLAYYNNNPQIADELFNVAISNDPELSYWYVELANLFLLNNQTESARKVLTNCLDLIYPHDHCNDYYNDIYLTNKPLDVGFLNEVVKKYFNLN